MDLATVDGMESGRAENKQLCVVRVKPLGAGGEGVEASSSSGKTVVKVWSSFDLLNK